LSSSSIYKYLRIVVNSAMDLKLVKDERVVSAMGTLGMI
jgi:hypothetical protein